MKRWGDDEKTLLRDWYGRLSLPRLARKFAQAGFNRTPAACLCQAQRMGLSPARLDGLVSLDEAARLLDIPIHHIYHRIQRGTIRATGQGKRRFLDLDTLDQLAELFPPAPARCYTKTETIRRLGYCESHVTRLLQGGFLAGVRRGDRWLVDADAVDTMVDQLKASGATRLRWPGLVEFLQERKAS